MLPPRSARGGRLKAHYDETQLSSNQATLAHLVALRARLASLVDIACMHQAVRAETDRAAKRARWEELKVASIARTVTAVYALALTHLLMRLSTNLVARHLMLEHAAGAPAGGRERGAEAEAREQNGHGPAPPRAGLPVSSQLRLLSAADHLVKGAGLPRLLALVQAAVLPACAALPDTAPLGARELGALVEAVRRPLEREEGAYARLLACVLPPPDEAAPEPAAGSADPDAWTDAQLQAEVADALRSAPFAVLVQQTLDGCFCELRDELARSACPPGAAGANALPLAKAIPRIAHCTAAVLDAPAHAGRDAARANRFLLAACRAPCLDELCFMAYAPQPADNDAALRAEGETGCYARCLPHAPEPPPAGGARAPPLLRADAERRGGSRGGGAARERPIGECYDADDY